VCVLSHCGGRARAPCGRAASEGSVPGHCKTAADYVDANQMLSPEERLAAKAMLSVSRR
jgi:hypothetical protein